MPITFDPVTLRLFVAVCEERNIARAAERESIVPSAISKRIAAIEADIGVALLVRGRRGIVPTPAGETLLRQARNLLAGMGRMQAELSEFARGAQGSVRVMASVSVLAERLPDDIATFLARWQSVRVSLDEDVSAKIVQTVREGGAEIGVLWDIVDVGGLETVRYRSDHLCVAVPLSHRFAHRKRLRYEETLAETSVGVAPGGLMDRILRRHAAALGHEVVHRIQISGLETACRIVAAGLGIAVLPAEAVSTQARQASIALVPLAEEWATRRFVVCYRPAGDLTQATRLLIEHLGAQASDS